MPLGTLKGKLLFELKYSLIIFLNIGTATEEPVSFFPRLKGLSNPVYNSYN
jgi:hypothetical protein